MSLILRWLASHGIAITVVLLLLLGGWLPASDTDSPSTEGEAAPEAPVIPGPATPAAAAQPAAPAAAGERPAAPRSQLSAAQPVGDRQAQQAPAVAVEPAPLTANATWPPAADPALLFRPTQSVTEPNKGVSASKPTSSVPGQPGDGIASIGVYRPVEKAETALARARRAFWAGDYALAVTSYDEAIAESTLAPEPYGELGNVYTYLGKPEAAAEQFLAAGERLIKQGRFTEAGRLVAHLRELSAPQARLLEEQLTTAGWTDVERQLDAAASQDEQQPAMPRGGAQ